jgi:hypothetical protein
VSAVAVQTLMNNYVAITSKKFAVSVVVECVGVLVFTFLGSTVTPENAAW